MATITEGASGMGKARQFAARQFAAHGTQAIIIALQSRRSLSLSLFWWLVVLIVVGWLILVDGGRLIGLWV